jgi:hypothetical protein
MSARDIRARLDRMEKALGRRPDIPECRFHGTACLLGARWPLPFPEEADAELFQWLRELKRAAGEELGPSRRELWEMGVHDLVTEEEKRQRAAELGEWIAELEAKNAVVEAELLAEREAPPWGAS